MSTEEFDKKWQALTERREALEDAEREFRNAVRGRDDEGEPVAPPTVKQLDEHQKRQRELLSVLQQMLAIGEAPVEPVPRAEPPEAQLSPQQFQAALTERRDRLRQPTMDALAAAGVVIDPTDHVAAEMIGYLIWHYCTDLNASRERRRQWEKESAADHARAGAFHFELKAISARVRELVQKFAA